MKIFLVGGAVRDTLMFKTPSDHDWVVVGASESDMIDRGFKQVGASFPVFLHPETGEEYALARTEKKVGAELAQAFIDLGYSLDTEYDIHHLTKSIKNN